MRAILARPTVLGVLVATALSCAGLPVHSWLLGLAVPLLGIGCFAMVLNLKAAERCLVPAGACLLLALVLPVLRGFAWSLLANPWVQAALLVLVVLAVLIALSKVMFTKSGGRSRIATRRRVRERRAIVGPADAQQIPSPRSSRGLKTVAFVEDTDVRR